MNRLKTTVLVALPLLLLACGSERVPTAGSGGTSGFAGNGGTAGLGGAGGIAGSAGAAGTGGIAGTGGDAGSAGVAGEFGGSGGTGGIAGSAGTSGIGGTGGIAGSAGMGGAGSGGVAGGGFPSVSSVSAPGPFTTKNPQGDPEGPNCTVHRPATLGENGLKHPVIVWGMGTGGFNLYQPAFELWASHGFIVVGGLLGHGQGSGEEMLGCLSYICDHYAPNVDCRAGASGHSQGGGGAIMAGQDPRVITTAPVQPYIAQGFGGYDVASINKQVGPMLLLSGTLDNIAVPAVNQQPVFDMTNVPVFWANRVGEDHVSVGTDGLESYREVILAWFRIHLMGDNTWRPMFYGSSCELCTNATDWMTQRKNIQ